VRTSGLPIGAAGQPGNRGARPACWGIRTLRLMKSSRQKLRGFGLIVASVFGFAIGVSAQSQPDEAQPASTGAISGQVVTDTGQPLGGAAVFVRAYGSTGSGRTTTTDAGGNFQVSGLEPISYTVGAAFSAFVSAPRDPDSSQSSYYRVGDSVKIRLTKGGVITGAVVTSADEPVVAVKVRAYMIRDSNGRPARFGTPIRERTTDDRGIYRIYGLLAGTYIVSAGGTAFSAFNTGVYDTDTPTFAPSSPRETAMEVEVRPGAEASNIDIRYHGEPGHIISGKAVDPAGAAAGTSTIYLSPASGGVSQWSNSTYQPPGAQGFSFIGIADGDYDLVAHAYFPTGDLALSEAKRIKVKGTDISGLELLVKPLGSITGRVAFEESKVPECNGKRRQIFAETIIVPWHNEKNSPKDQPQMAWLGSPVFPDKQGDFMMRNLLPGQYRLNTRPLAKYWYLKSITLPSSSPAVRGPATKGAQAVRLVDAARNWTTLKSGERLSRVVITFAAGAASLKGQIKPAEGQKLPPKLFVYLVPAEPDKAEDVLRFFVAPTEADGSFALNNLPPGLYLTLAKVAGESESNVLSKLRLPEEAESRTKLHQEAMLSKVETELKPCQNVTDYSLPLKL
jgi:hypothetical protein